MSAYTPAATAEALVQFFEQWAPFREAVIGYRASLLADGFSESAAEEMTIDLHGYFMAQLTAAVKT